MRLAAKVDAVQASIVEALRSAGCSVQTLASVGAGCPDLLVGFRGQNFLLELKKPKGQLSERQVSWHRLWRGQRATARSVEEALDVLGLRMGARIQEWK